MPIEIVVPRLGWSMEEGVFGEWLKAPGEAVRAGEMIYVLEGEKAAQEIESFEAGTIWFAPDAPKKGETVKVGQLIGYLLAEGEAPPAIVTSPITAPRSAADSTSASKVERTSARSAGPAARRRARELSIELDEVTTPDPTGRVIRDDILKATIASARVEAAGVRGRAPFATPRARRRASDLGVHWKEAIGSGRNGRIRERDVDAIATRGNQKTQIEISPTAPGTHRPASKIRQAIAQRMMAGANQTAPVTLTTKVDATPLVAFRVKLKEEAKGGVAPSYIDTLVKLVAATLPECPLLNACWHRDGIFTYDAINIAIAVDTNVGLMAPVLANAANLTLAQIASRSKTLIEKARAGALTQGDLQGGTFTITNLGAFGIDHFTPIINLPQSAILGIGRIVKEPVVRDNAIVPGETMTLSLTFDHRVIDGAPAAAWLQLLAELIQAPEAAIGP